MQSYRKFLGTDQVINVLKELARKKQRSVTLKTTKDPKIVTCLQFFRSSDNTKSFLLHKKVCKLFDDIIANNQTVIFADLLALPYFSQRLSDNSNPQIYKVLSSLIKQTLRHGHVEILKLLLNVESLKNAFLDKFDFYLEDQKLSFLSHTVPNTNFALRHLIKIDKFLNLYNFEQRLIIMKKSLQLSDVSLVDPILRSFSYLRDIPEPLSCGTHPVQNFTQSKKKKFNLIIHNGLLLNLFYKDTYKAFKRYAQKTFNLDLDQYIKKIYYELSLSDHRKKYDLSTTLRVFFEDEFVFKYDFFSFITLCYYQDYLQDLNAELNSLQSSRNCHQTIEDLIKSKKDQFSLLLLKSSMPVLKSFTQFVFSSKGTFNTFFSCLGDKTDLLKDFKVREIFAEKILELLPSDPILKYSQGHLDVLSTILSDETFEIACKVMSRHEQRALLEQQHKFRDLLKKNSKALLSLRWVINNNTIFDQSLVSLSSLFNDNILSYKKNSFLLWFFGSFADSLLAGPFLEDNSFKIIANESLKEHKELLENLTNSFLVNVNTFIESASIEKNLHNCLLTVLDKIKAQIISCDLPERAADYFRQLHQYWKNFVDNINWQYPHARDSLNQKIQAISLLESNLVTKSADKIIPTRLRRDSDEILRSSPTSVLEFSNRLVINKSILKGPSL